jgi:hypothetical protein
MSGMVERVERAIAQEMNYGWLYDDRLTAMCRPEAIERNWGFVRSAARAAIAAMRKPTVEMFCAGDEEIIQALNDHGGVRRDPTPAESAWMAMIDEALK